MAPKRLNQASGQQQKSGSASATKIWKHMLDPYEKGISPQERRSRIKARRCRNSRDGEKQEKKKTEALVENSKARCDILDNHIQFLEQQLEMSRKKTETAEALLVQSNARCFDMYNHIQFLEQQLKMKNQEPQEAANCSIVFIPLPQQEHVIHTEHSDNDLYLPEKLTLIVDRL